MIFIRMRKRTILIIAVVVVLLAVGAFINTHPKTKTKSDAVVIDYYALGDSVAAGFGLETSSDPSACGRTNEAYPTLVARSLRLNMESLACSGAAINQGLMTKQDVNKALITPQLDALFSKNRPKLITLTIGANDIDWTKIITKCFTSDCGNDTDTQTVAAKLQGLNTGLRTVMTKISEHYGPNPPHVIVTGYYQVFSADVLSCPDASGITNMEAAWWRTQETSLNTIIRNVASSYKFARYADIDFVNHELCGEPSWVQNFQSAGLFHPTDEGQQDITSAVISANNLFPKK
jgi:lysophospholipase L1-like esterase